VNTELLQQVEIALANMVSYQSSGNSPSIHEYGQARRTLEAVRAAQSPSQPLVEVQEPVAAWLSESLGDAVSAKKKSDMEQHNGMPGKKIAALYETPLYRAAPVRGLPLTEAQMDDFKGDNAALCRSIEALLSLDAAGALVPHGVGGHARGLLSAAFVRLGGGK